MLSFSSLLSPYIHVHFPLYVILILLCWNFLALILIRLIKTKTHLNNTHTRKCYHIIIFTSAWFIQTMWGLPTLFLFAVMVVCTILFVVYLGNRLHFYQALTRKRDGEKNQLRIVVSLLGTALGGLLSNLISVHFAPISYLVVGWGDASGNLVGEKWGKHQYWVHHVDHYQTVRSVEGSLGVFAASVLAILVGLFVLHTGFILALSTGILVGFIAAIAEAVSIYNLDNCLMQIVVTLMLRWMLG